MKNLLPLIFLFSFFSLNAQHQDKVDFIRGDVFIEPIPLEKRINGTVTYQFRVLKDVDSIFLDAKNMELESIDLDFNDSTPYTYDEKQIIVNQKFKEGEEHFLIIHYSCSPTQTVYFLGWEDNILGNEQIWTQGQGKYTSHWLPSFDDMEEKVEFDLKFGHRFDKKKFIANGRSVNIGATLHHTGKKLVSFDMQKPMSSYLLAFAIGNYEKEKITSKSGISIENYYYPQDSLRVEPTYRYTKQIFDFLEDEIGVAYPWQNYKQIPVRDFLYAGMENTTATIFSDQYMIDSIAFVDKNYVNVNAHELAHQWFGNLVTEKDGNHHWLHEGFATYYAQLAEKELFGEDHYYWKLYNSLTELQNTIDSGNGQSLTDPKASSLVFYEKGAWALYMLRNQVGDKAFKKGIKKYLKNYQFKNVTISDFLKEIEASSGQNLSDFNKNWLQNDGLEIKAAKEQLQKDSESLQLLFTMEADLQKAQSDDLDYGSYWERTYSVYFKKHLVENYNRILAEPLLIKAFESDTVPIRQALSKNIDSISPAMKIKYESLLLDKSYVTIENALFKLWSTYPNEQKKYLEQTKAIIGLPNKNVRLLWLTLAIVTNDYESQNTKVFFQELSGYTAPKFGWEIRIGAFQYLHQTLGLNDETLKNLIQATVHHSWQFKKFARNLIEELLKDADYKVRLQNITKELKDEELRYMNTKLNK